jgi:hypothetical protein
MEPHTALLCLIFQICHCALFECGLSLFQRRKFSIQSALGILMMTFAGMFLLGDLFRMFGV